MPCVLMRALWRSTGEKHLILQKETETRRLHEAERRAELQPGGIQGRTEGSTHSTTRLLRFWKAPSGMWLMRLRASVMACSAGRLLSALTGISVSALSSSHRWRREDSPSKLLSGTREMRLASRRLVEERMEMINAGEMKIECWGAISGNPAGSIPGRQ